MIQRSFSPTHAARIEAEFDEAALGTPVVNVRDGVVYVVDGQHRLAALKAHRFDNDHDYTIVCEVYEGLTDREMAALFLWINRGRRRVEPFDAFMIACTAEHAREVGVRRAVEAQGVKVSKMKKQNCVAAVGALLKVYDAAGDVVLGQAVRAVRDGFDGDAAGYDGVILEGLGLVFSRYNGSVDEKLLVRAFASLRNGPLGLLQKANSKRDQTKQRKTRCIAGVVVDLYNQQQPKKRLPDYWRELKIRTAEAS